MITTRKWPGRDLYTVFRDGVGVALVKREGDHYLLKMSDGFGIMVFGSVLLAMQEVGARV